MAYGLPQLQTPDIVGGYQQGVQWNQQQKRQPILEAMDAAKLKATQQQIQSQSAIQSLNELKSKELEEKSRAALMEDIAMGGKWGMEQLAKAEESGLDKDAYWRENVYPVFAQTYGEEKVSFMRDNPEVLGLLSEMNTAKGQSKIDALDPEKRFKMISDLRGDVESISKDFTKVADAYTRVNSVFESNQQAIDDFKNRALTNENNEVTSTEAFGDMALIFNYMKMLDPGSTVREGEFANAQNTGSVSDQVRNWYNAALKGTRLTPEQRQGILRQAKGLYSSAYESNKSRLGKYERQADEFGLPKNQIFDPVPKEFMEDKKPEDKEQDVDRLKSQLEILEQDLGLQ